MPFSEQKCGLDPNLISSADILATRRYFFPPPERQEGQTQSSVLAAISIALALVTLTEAHQHPLRPLHSNVELQISHLFMPALSPQLCFCTGNCHCASFIKNEGSCPPQFRLVLRVRLLTLGGRFAHFLQALRTDPSGSITTMFATVTFPALSSGFTTCPQY